MRAIGIPWLALLAVGCASLPAQRMAPCVGAPRLIIETGADGVARAELRVLSYNVEGLPWPVRSGRGGQLRAIAAHLGAMREAGEAPHIVLLQEVFSRAASNAVASTAYPNLVAGPRRRQARPPREEDRLPGRRRPRQGEIGVKLTGGGLVILSDFPIVAYGSRPFPAGSCAGRDCLANKGVLYGRVAIPGIPAELDLFNTHMNSAGASRVPERRHTASHQVQMRALSAFITEVGDLSRPVLLAGDFNMRHSEARFEEFERAQPLELVHRYCIDAPSVCDVRMSWEGDAPWMDTQDLQLFAPGRGLFIRPVRVEAMFDGGPGGADLSDHDGLLVTYELSWRAEPLHDVQGRCR